MTNATRTETSRPSTRHRVVGPDSQCNVSFNPRTLSLFLGPNIIVENIVHLFQRPPISLGHKKPRPNERQSTEHTEEDIRPIASVLNERGGYQSNNEVVEPVRHGRICDALCSERGREYFSRHRPWDRAPGCAVGQHKEAEERNAGPCFSCMARPAIFELAHENSDYKMGNDHACCSSKEERSTTESVHTP